MQQIQGKDQVGHNNICYGCGRSVARAIKHSIPEFSFLASVVSSWHHHVIAANFLCHGCYVRAKREMAQRNIVDSNRFANIEGNQVFN
ncbi:unnamed protein product [Parnassius apollo]|uniref:(apollo) hypothetical protein n=1 Tax=Parnassius apollo TaxID=110799 RepID=A0A8S3VZU7_PARAO|nr:unnamed protein product [Parnassius apollo]